MIGFTAGVKKRDLKVFLKNYGKGIDKRTDLWYNMWVKQSRASHSHLYTSVLRVEYGKCGIPLVRVWRILSFAHFFVGITE